MKIRLHFEVWADAEIVRGTRGDNEAPNGRFVFRLTDDVTVALPKKGDEVVVGSGDYTSEP